MTLEKIRSVCGHQPFRPFVLHLPDGRNVLVEHPDFVSFEEGDRVVVITHPDDTESLIDLFLVSDLTVKAPVPERQP